MFERLINSQNFGNFLLGENSCEISWFSGRKSTSLNRSQWNLDVMSAAALLNKVMIFKIRAEVFGWRPKLNWDLVSWPQITNRHRASTNMYSLTFRVRVTTPPHYGRNGTAHAAGASILSPARGVFFRHAYSVRVRHTCAGPGGLPMGSATHFHSVAIATQPVHRLQIRPMMHN